jgi:predicted nuclease of predicted toxin-antitoxin system
VVIWVDAQLPPAIAAWISDAFGMEAKAVRELGLRDAMDRQIFLAAKRESAVVMTKDSDFIRLLDELGPPPQVIWVTCGNTSNARLKQILSSTLTDAVALLDSGEKLVEISGG